MWQTGDAKWKERIEGLLKAQNLFVSSNDSSKNVIFEYPCETWGTCKTDQFSFKGYLARWMADTVKLAPFTRQTILSRLQPTAEAAAAQCVGGKTGSFCGMKWTLGKYDGNIGVGEQMSALEFVQANLLDEVDGPMTTRTGGTSKGDSSAGTGSGSGDKPSEPKPITIADKIGAGLATAVVAVMIVGWTAVMMT